MEGEEYTGEEEFVDEEEIGEEVVLPDDLPPPDEEPENNDASNPDDMDHELTIPDTSLAKFTHHTDSVFSVSINPKAPNVVCSGGCDDLAYVFDLSQPKGQPLVLSGHKDSVTQVLFSPTDALLATASLDATCKIWSGNGTLLHTLEGPSESIESIVWHSKGPILFAGGGDGLGWMWNALQGKVMNVFSGHSAAINTAKFTPEGKKILTASDDGTVRVWDPKSAQSLHIFKAGFGSSVQFHSEAVTALVCMGDNDEAGIAVTGGTDGRSVILNYNSGKLMGAFTGHSKSVESITFCKSHPFVITCSLDKSIQVWDLNTQQVRSTMQHSDGVMKVSSCSNPHLVISGSLDKSLCLWDVRSGQSVQKFTGHTDHILDFDTFNNLLVSSSDDKTVRYWNLY
uniref:Uncharacterized protein n=1 Tax=Arcella intermedia TaxID=1963864 RepID=A0A6B2L665_9EUKA|eukprot:TRINITY_DN504_c0_g1_i1.p1 TRINITY_DN504_c0_g1~~TRINITY_DN504_c0_g1_i1.p1  ORF type:complete len:408 (-),score=87.74 TRINITY_DN504_c0_g1_i1:47-1240(-)